MKFKPVSRGLLIHDLNQLYKLHVLEKKEILKKCSLSTAWWQQAFEWNQTALFAGNLFSKKN